MTKREQTRAELLAALAELSRLRPEWRLGQMIANVAMTAGRLDAGGVWDLEDEEALTAVRELLNQFDVPTKCISGVEDGMKWFREYAGTDDVLLVTGSHLVVSEALPAAESAASGPF
jgi:hypothetical protein